MVAGEGVARGDEVRRGDGERLGGGDEVGFVRAEEIEHRGEGGGLAEAGAQIVRGHAGEREQAQRAILVGKQPAERGKRERLGIGWG